MNAVTKNDLFRAQYTKQLVKPALDALQKINPQSVGYDTDAHAKIKTFTAWLGEIALKADDVIDRAQVQYDNRPKKIINDASMRLFVIPQDIEREQKTIEHKVAAHQMKSDEFKKKSFSDAEIEAITPYPQGELNAHNGVIANLKAELERVKAFLDDAPRFDIGLLGIEPA